VSALSALPTMLRVGFAEAVAYRAEMLVWVLATTMPFVNLALWTAVSAGGAVQGVAGTWSSGKFVAYFLSVFVVRQLLSAWAAWQINFEVRQGVLAMRLLRPLHPVVSYLVENLAYLPMRVAVSVPVGVVLAWTGAAAYLSPRPEIWGLWALSIAGGFGITFFANVAIGALAFFLESSVKIMDVWLAAFFVFSGYLVPLDLFPPWLRVAAESLPFRYQLGLPVELMTGAHTVATALPLLARQWAWALALGLGSLALWRRGVQRFQAFGG
jgi:ABC-2 type transport system permease protein